MQTILDFFSGGAITIGTVYWTCLFVGAALAVISLVFGEILDIAFDTGDMGPVSGPVIATFLVLFGGFGLIFKNTVALSTAGSVFASLIVSVGGSAAMYYLVIKTLLSQAGGTTFEPKDAAGLEAEVITHIPKGGIGEITFDTNAGRMSGPARSSDNGEIIRGSAVHIDRYVGGTWHVTKIASPSEMRPEKSEPEEDNIEHEESDKVE